MLGVGAALAAPTIVRYNSLMPLWFPEKPVDLSDMELRMVAKMWLHGHNYGMGAEQILRMTMKGLTDAS